MSLKCEPSSKPLTSPPAEQSQREAQGVRGSRGAEGYRMNHRIVSHGYDFGRTRSVLALQTHDMGGYAILGVKTRLEIAFV